MSSSASNRWTVSWIGVAALVMQTVVLTGCEGAFIEVPGKRTAVAGTQPATHSSPSKADASEITSVARPEDSQRSVVPPSVAAPATTRADVPLRPTTVAVIPAVTPPSPTAAAESETTPVAPPEGSQRSVVTPSPVEKSTLTPSRQLTSTAGDTLPGGGFDAHIEDSPCNPFILVEDELWFWANEVRWHPDGSAVFFSQGPVVYAAATDGSRLEVAADAASSDRTRGRPRVDFYGPMTSFDIRPQGDRLVYATCAFRQDAPTVLDTDHEYEIAVVDLERAAVERLTTNRHFENYPSWSPDGTRIALVAGRSTPYDMFDDATLHVFRTDGSGRRVISIDDHALGFHPPQWSPDGTRLAVVGRHEGWKEEHAVFVFGVDGSGVVRLGRTASGPAWSPDGTRLAYVGPETFLGDERGLFTVAADGTQVQQISLPTGWEPRYGGTHSALQALNWIPTLAWSPAGDHLLYTCDLHVCVVALDGSPVGRSPIELDRGSVAAWSPDGRRIAVASGSFWSREDVRAYPVAELLYTMAPGGTDVRLLAKYDVEGQLRSVGPQPGTGSVDVSGCAAGLVVPDPTANPDLVRDCEALLRVQAAWQHTLNWSTDRPLGEWEGIELGGSPPRLRVLQLNRWSVSPHSWTKLGLWGTIPPELGALDELRVLQLRGNVLTGSIPPELGRLTHLEELDLTDNYLGGHVPKELSSLTALEDLTLGGNFLTGCIPPKLAGLEFDRTDLGRLGLPECEAAA